MGEQVSSVRLLATKKRKALAFARALRAAEKAGFEFRRACLECGEDAARADDTRTTLPGAISEYAHFLESVYDRP